MSYATRALKSADPRFARIYRKMGVYNTKVEVAENTPSVVAPVTPVAAAPSTPAQPWVNPVATPPVTEEDDGKDEMRALREEYEKVLGKRPFMGWDEKELRERMADANKGE